ncbi:MAG: phospholipase D family protein [Xanthomonadales bacterium]|nr:phospholipase D family protein [Xanthomonadales bacterium]ODU92706.1 MAG: cardiolipin synthase [Rhodanobacter sp. SCN 66-43]OJY83931.1 MAG: phospholipase D family protein [Xanthomonadales bacterium 66-474]
MLVAIILILLVLVVAGAILADRLAPKASGEPSRTLPIQPDATPLDRAVAPLLAAHPDLSGAVMLNDGPTAFASRALCTRDAGRSLDLQYYMWHDDLCGRLLAREVARAADRGVRVRMLLDDMNAYGLDQQMLALDAHPNIEIRVYNPFRNRSGLWRLLETVVRALRINHRMHNKSWIADGRIAIVGGRNIGEEYFNAASGTNFRDLDVLLMGPVVADAEGIFDRYWNSDTVVPLKALGNQDPERMRQLRDDVRGESTSDRAREYLAQVESARGVEAFLKGQRHLAWVDKIEVVADPPAKWRRDDRGEWLVRRLVDAIGTATTRAWLISPYFVPGKHGTRQLLDLARKGVDVRVVTNSLAANDVPAVHAGYARYRKPLLEGGVKLYELRAQGHPGSAGLFGSSGASLHTKAFVIDGHDGFIGSFNLDMRSATLNTEMGVLFDDAELGKSLEDEFRRLADPALSYTVRLDANGKLRWEDAVRQPPAILEREPDATLARRVIAKVLRWLPIETQL